MSIWGFEGIDASGKNTQTKALLRLVKKPHLIAFPRYTAYPLGEIILSELKNPALHPASRQALLLADKYGAALDIHERNRDGYTVLLDRYKLSARVYGASDGLDPRWLDDTHALLPEPDHWFLLDIPVEESVRRRPERRDHYEKNLDKLREIRERYLFEFNTGRAVQPAKWHILDGMKPKDEITHEILSIVGP